MTNASNNSSFNKLIGVKEVDESISDIQHAYNRVINVVMQFENIFRGIRDEETLVKVASIFKQLETYRLQLKEARQGIEKAAYEAVQLKQFLDSQKAIATASLTKDQNDQEQKEIESWSLNFKNHTLQLELTFVGGVEEILVVDVDRKFLASTKNHIKFQVHHNSEKDSIVLPMSKSKEIKLPYKLFDLEAEGSYILVRPLTVTAAPVTRFVEFVTKFGVHSHPAFTSLIMFCTALHFADENAIKITFVDDDINWIVDFNNRYTSVKFINKTADRLFSRVEFLSASSEKICFRQMFDLNDNVYDLPTLNNGVKTIWIDQGFFNHPDIKPSVEPTIMTMMPQEFKEFLERTGNPNYPRFDRLMAFCTMLIPSIKEKLIFTIKPSSAIAKQKNDLWAMVDEVTKDL